MVFNDDGSCNSGNKIFQRFNVENVQLNRNILESHRWREVCKKQNGMDELKVRKVEKKIQTVLNQFTAQNE